jgi:hypothetical protein
MCVSCGCWYSGSESEPGHPEDASVMPKVPVSKADLGSGKSNK